MDAVELFFNAKDDNQDKDHQLVLGNFLRQIGELENSLYYLQAIHQGSWIRRLRFSIDQTYQESRIYGISCLKSSFRSSWRHSANLLEQIQILKAERDLTANSIGRILNGKDTSAVPGLTSSLPGPTIATTVILPGMAIFGVGIFIAHWALTVNWHKLLDLTLDLWMASKNLLQDWIATPILGIWKTIRYRNSNLALVSAAALKADMNSLERMLLNFARRHYPNIPEKVVLEQIQSGDTTLMLRRYEMELQAPLRNALSGSLITMLLIQVQKSKVDLESAMMAMDKLLRANELNFELLAVMPLLAVLYLMGGAAKRWFAKLKNCSEQSLIQQLAREMHQIEMLLNANHHSDLDTQQGEILILIDRILKTWKKFPSSWQSQYGDSLYADLASLLDQRSTQSKLWDCSRMHQFYPFLNPLFRSF